jgi:pre-mRNA-splicing factor 18
MRASEWKRRKWQYEEAQAQAQATKVGHDTTASSTAKRPKTDNEVVATAATATAATTTTCTTSSSQEEEDAPHQEDDNPHKNKYKDHEKDEVAVDLQSHQVTQQLRIMGLPVRLFGEISDPNRQQRLRRALQQQNETLVGVQETNEFRLETGHRIRNTFLEKGNMSTPTTTATTKDHSDRKQRIGNPKETQGTSNTTTTTTTTIITKESLPTDPYKKIYKYFKELLRQWEYQLQQRPDDVQQSMAGQNETKTMQQCHDYIQPLFKQCKKRQVESGQVQNIVKIIDYCLEGEFVKAHDAYMDVAIGRAAWPIGVTMVGIHARSGRAKIESSNVAHVMNSELQRKYLTSIKRLLTFAQSQRPDIHPSKKVVN